MATTHQIDSYNDGNYNQDWGVIDDSWIDQPTPTSNYGTDWSMVASSESISAYKRCVLRLDVPSPPVKSAKIKDIKLILTVLRHESLTHTGSCHDQNVYMLPLQTSFDEVDVTWNNRKAATPWVSAGGDFLNENSAIIDGNVEQYAVTLNDFWYIEAYWPSRIFTIYPDSGLSWESEYKYYMLRTDQGSHFVIHYKTTGAEDGQWYHRPRLNITYTVEEPEFFTNDNDKLVITPDSANKTYPRLDWGAYKGADFYMYKLFGPNTANPPTEHWYSTTDSAKCYYTDTNPGIYGDCVYYYQVHLLCRDNYSNEYSTVSNVARFYRPSISSFTFDDYTPDAWQEVTATTTCHVTSKPSDITISKYNYDWQGGSTVQGWVTLATPANVHAETHRYAATGTFTPTARVESNEGFWSSTRVSGSNVVVANIAPIAILRGPTYIAKDTNYVFRGDESYDQNSNGTISNWQWDKTYVAPFTADTAVSYPTYSTNWTSTGTTTMAMRVSDGSLNSESVVLSVTVYDNSGTILSLSSYTKISAREWGEENIFSENLHLGANYGELVWTGKDFPRFTLSGESLGQKGLVDVKLLLDYSDTPTRLKLFVTENQKWLIGYLTNFRRTDRGGEVEDYHWEAEFVCDAKE